ncbi:hypothetical protein V1511DRAFT_506774 [Dipodascopsis uninucleata]
MEELKRHTLKRCYSKDLEDSSMKDIESHSLKRRPPNIIISSTTDFTTSNANSIAPKTAPSSMANIGQQESNPQSLSVKRSAKDIMQGLALHCVSPGLPPMDNEMMENVLKCKAIEQQQRKLIAARQKSVELSSDLGNEDFNANRTADSIVRLSSESRSESEIEEDMDTDTEVKSNIEFRSKTNTVNKEVQNVRQQSEPKVISKPEYLTQSLPKRRATRPGRLHIVDPLQFQTGGYERAIHSAPLGPYSHTSRSTQLRKNMHIAHSFRRNVDRNALTSQASKSSNRQFEAEADHLGSEYHQYENNNGEINQTMYRARVPASVIATNRRSDGYSQNAASFHSRRLSHPQPVTREMTSGCKKCSEARVHSRTFSDDSTTEGVMEDLIKSNDGISHSNNRALGFKRPQKNSTKPSSNDSHLLLKKKFLELCAEAWDLFHSTEG